MKLTITEMNPRVPWELVADPMGTLGTAAVAVCFFLSPSCNQIRLRDW